MKRTPKYTEQQSTSRTCRPSVVSLTPIPSGKRLPCQFVNWFDVAAVGCCKSYDVKAEPIGDTYLIALTLTLLQLPFSVFFTGTTRYQDAIDATL
jgi:hypothetical protein